MVEPSSLAFLVNVGIEVGWKPVSSFCILFDPYADADARAFEQAKAFVVNLDFALFPSQQIRPLLSDMFLADKHTFLSRDCIAHHASQSSRLVPGPTPNPADTIGIIKVVILFAVGIQFAG